MPDEVTEKLYATTDAMVWAQEWCRIAREVRAAGEEIIDEGWMVGWFANAMCVAEDHLKRRLEASPKSPGALCSPTYDRQPFDEDPNEIWEYGHEGHGYWGAR